jgi:hypothetical protein
MLEPPPPCACPCAPPTSHACPVTRPQHPGLGLEEELPARSHVCGKPHQGLESHLESRAKAVPRSNLDVAAGWVSPSSRGLWGGRRSAALHRRCWQPEPQPPRVQMRGEAEPAPRIRGRRCGGLRTRWRTRSATVSCASGSTCQKPHQHARLVLMGRAVCMRIGHPPGGTSGCPSAGRGADLSRRWVLKKANMASHVSRSAIEHSTACEWQG